jgi:hypothetical protein
VETGQRELLDWIDGWLQRGQAEISDQGRIA